MIPDETVSIWSHDDVLPVAVMVASPPPEQTADSLLWWVSGVVVGEQFASSERSSVKVRSGPGGDMFLWRGFSLHLRPTQVEDYALNLGGGRLKIIVIGRFDPQKGFEPYEVTVSLDRAQNLDATDLRSVEDVVLSAPMPDEVGVWLEAFVAEHYVPRRRGKGRGKKRSKALFDAEVGDWAGDTT